MNLSRGYSTSFAVKTDKAITLLPVLEELYEWGVKTGILNRIGENNNLRKERAFLCIDCFL